MDKTLSRAELDALEVSLLPERATLYGGLTFTSIHVGKVVEIASQYKSSGTIVQAGVVEVIL